MQVVTKRPTV